MTEAIPDIDVSMASDITTTESKPSALYQSRMESLDESRYLCVSIVSVLAAVISVVYACTHLLAIMF